jgi:hypothetical protein
MTLKVTGQSTSTTNKLACKDKIKRQISIGITYNFCVRGDGATSINRNQCVPGGEVSGASFTYSVYSGDYRYNYDPKPKKYNYWVKPTDTFTQSEYDTLFGNYCLTYVPLVHSRMQWREVDTKTNTWKAWSIPKYKPGKPKKSNPLAWGKAIKCPGL